MPLDFSTLGEMSEEESIAFDRRIIDNINKRTNMNPNDILASSGDTIKLSQLNVGDTIQGIITATPQILPDTDFQTREQKKSKKGNLLWQMRLTLEVAGEAKTIYLSKGAYYDTVNAIKAAGIKSFEDVEGAAWGIKRIEDEPSATPGFAPRKNYDVKFKAQS